MIEIYVAISLKQNECTLNNRWFEDYPTAWKYAQDVEKDSGCILAVIFIDKFNPEKD
jgi:hypothetical protein